MYEDIDDLLAECEHIINDYIKLCIWIKQDKRSKSEKMKSVLIHVLNLRLLLSVQDIL